MFIRQIIVSAGGKNRESMIRIQTDKQVAAKYRRGISRIPRNRKTLKKTGTGKAPARLGTTEM